jgi:ABC-2 type transport system ATP-binding protein
VIRFLHLGKRYGDMVAVEALQFEIGAGEVFGFIGPNGAGKTTTIRMMMGLLAPTEGTVELAGHDIRTAAEAAKAVTGYVPDHAFLYDKLTAREFLHFVGGLYGLAGAALGARADELLADFALADRAEELTETFSHGMRQRLALAAALLHRPRLLVLDEPMVGLDPQGAVALRQLVRRLAAAGVTVFLSTHSLHVAEELCDRIGVLDRGRLVALGTLPELRARAAVAAAPGASLEDVFLRLTGAA